MPDPDSLAALRHALADVGEYSRLIVGVPLRAYQVEAARAVVDAILGRRPRDMVVILMSRQAGKNELSAQVEAYALTIFSGRGGQLVKAAPTFKPQIVNSMMRLRDRLNNALTRDLVRASHGYIIAVGHARILFLSADPNSQVVGATASLALLIDEAQDCDPEVLTKAFMPMVASTNAPRIWFGTAWTDDDPLQQAKARALELERADGIRRVFEYPWTAIAEHNPAYRTFVEAERARLGPRHPLFLTQYALEPVAAAGKLLSDEQRALLMGDHPRLDGPRDGYAYVAGLDLAGPSETDPTDESRRRDVDRSVLTIAEVDRPDHLHGPQARVVRRYIWEGRKHLEQLQDFKDLILAWRCRTIAVDATGLGQPIAELLAATFGDAKDGGRILPVPISQTSKSALGYEVISSINTHALKEYRADVDDVAAATFWRELRATDRTMRSAMLMAWSARPPQHDDTVVSLALANRAAQQTPPPPASTILPNPNPYDGGSRY